MKDLSDNQLRGLETKLTLSDVNECVLTKLCHPQNVERFSEFAEVQKIECLDRAQ